MDCEIEVFGQLVALQAGFPRKQKTKKKARRKRIMNTPRYKEKQKENSTILFSKPSEWKFYTVPFNSDANTPHKIPTTKWNQRNTVQMGMS